MDILYRDDDLVAVNKPSGIVVHRGWERAARPLLQQVRDAVGSYVYPVHRLDRAASGVVVFALTREATRSLQDQLAGRAHKRYLALVRGIPALEGTIDYPIPRAPGGPRVDAVTRYHRLHVFERYAVVEIFPRSGRTHQIRRHFKHISHPLIGDVRYGKGEHNRLFRERFGLHRLALHARSLRLRHPRTDQELQLSAPLTPDLDALFRAIGFSEPEPCG